MATIAAARLRRAGVAPRLVTGVAQALPFRDQSADSLVATFPAEYILDPATHAEIRRVLVPNGRLVIVPLAQLDPGLYTRLIDLAYRLTLQAPVRRDERAAPAASLQIAGIELERRWVAVGRSRVLLLVGERR